MKKIIYLSLALFLLTGCTIKYDLDLTQSDIIKEQMEIDEDDTSNQYFETIKNYNGNIRAIYSDQDSDSLAKDPDLEYYDVQNNSDETNANLVIDYTFSNEDFPNSNIINTCYDRVTYYNENDSIDINTSNEFLCFDKYVSAQNVDVNIKINKNITNHNADEVNGNIYTWHLNRNNAYNKPIIISNIENQSSFEPKEDSSIKLPIVLMILLGFAIFIIGLFIYKNRKYK